METTKLLTVIQVINFLATLPMNQEIHDLDIFVAPSDTKLVAETMADGTLRIIALG